MIKKLLHIDDDMDDREIFMECIHAIDPEIQCAQMNNSKVALQNIKTRTLPSADMVFIDLNMPCVSGLDLLKAMRQVQDYCELPVTILTTSSALLELHQSELLGANYFLTKPYTIGEWQSSLEQVLKNCWNNQ